MVWLPLAALAAWSRSWLFGTGRGTSVPRPASGAPPLEPGAGRRGEERVPNVPGPTRTPVRAHLLGALMPLRASKHQERAEETLRSRWMRTSSAGPSDLEDWMHLGKREVQTTVEDLLGG